MRLEELNTNPLDKPEFKAWFGNSVCRDADGNPLLLFHGSGEAQLELKDDRIFWASVSPSLANLYSSQYIGSKDENGDFKIYGNNFPNVVPVYMKIIKPYNADDHTMTVSKFISNLLQQSRSSLTPEIQKLKEIIETGRQREESGPHYNHHDFWYENISQFGLEGSKAITQLFKICGFDGIKYKETERMEGTTSLTYGVFTKDQVKFPFGL